MDPFTFHRVAGHGDMKTTMRYVHPSDADMDEAIVSARKVQAGHTSEHTGPKDKSAALTESSVADRTDKDLDGATRFEKGRATRCRLHARCACLGGYALTARGFALSPVDPDRTIPDVFVR